MSTSNSKNPSQNNNREEQQKQKLSLNTTGPWTFGYPICVNKKQSRLVCLHQSCQKYPFFCSACDDQSCENQHQHKDRITSIGFKELIKKLISQRKPPEQLEKSIKSYKTQLQQLLKNVGKFVQDQNKSMNDILKNSYEFQEDEEAIIKKLKQKKYQQIKGKELDKVWQKVTPSQEKKKLQKQTIQFIDSKRIQVQEMRKNFQDGGSVTQPKVNKTQQKKALK